MGSAYVDTSCLVAVALGEPGHARVASRLASYDRLFASTFLEAEIRSALEREHLPDSLAPLVSGLTWVYPRTRLEDHLARVFRHGYLRGADAWHLACALVVSPDPSAMTFLTLDARQAEVARSLGFPCPLPHPAKRGRTRATTSLTRGHVRG